MKKLYFILATLFGLVGILNAQTTTPANNEKKQILDIKPSKRCDNPQFRNNRHERRERMERLRERRQEWREHRKQWKREFRRDFKRERRNKETKKPIEKRERTFNLNNKAEKSTAPVERRGFRRKD